MIYNYEALAHVPIKHLPEPFNRIILGMALRYTMHDETVDLTSKGMSSAFIYTFLTRDTALPWSVKAGYLNFVVELSRLNAGISNEEFRLLLAIKLGLTADAFDRLLDGLLREYAGKKDSVTIQITL